MDIGSLDAQWVGWAAVAALFLTMSGQAWKQWRDRVKHGVSKVFFMGQIAASTLFLAYSAMVGDRVFVVGNALVLTAAIVGGAILLYNRARR
jgi:MtN3 and saliva related transmembrane protein